jgi:hypothetical protein
MLSSTTLVLALSVAAVASAHQNHARADRAAAAKRGEGSVKKRDQFSGVPMTWYPTDTGPCVAVTQFFLILPDNLAFSDACTGNSHSANDWVRISPFFHVAITFSISSHFYPTSTKRLILYNSL